MKLNEKIKVARQFACMLHEDKGQRYGDEPYSTHLDDVANCLLRFDETDKDLIAAAYLHDVMEDCEVSKAVMLEIFGEKVTALVFAVTDEPGANRKERKAKTYPKIKATAGALLVKLADRIANVEHSVKAGNVRMFKMYQKEHKEFTAQLRTIGEHDAMWAHLDGLINCYPAPKALPPPNPVEV